MTRTEFKTLIRNLIGRREEAVSFWITAALCVISTIFIISDVFIGYTGIEKRICYSVNGCLSLGIFISAFFALWKPREDVPPSYKIGRQVAVLLAWSALWGMLHLGKTISPMVQESGSLIASGLPSVVNVFLSPISVLNPGQSNIFNFLCLGSVVVLLLLFTAGLSWSYRKRSDLERKIENARETLFVHSLQKRLFQAVGLSVLIVLAGGALWRASGLWLIFSNWYKPLASFIFIVIETFCPLYTILTVRKDQAEIEAQLQGAPDLSELKPYRQPKIMLLFLGLLTLLFAFICLRQVINFWKYKTACDPHLMTLLGVLGTYLYVFTTGTKLSSAHTKAISTVRTALPFLYLPFWGFACYRVIHFASNQILTPFQIWISLIFFLLGIFNLMLVLRRMPQIRTLIQTSIAACIIALIGAPSVSFWMCERTIDNFLETSEAVVPENGKRMIRAVPHPEACDAQDLKKFVRALNVLEERAPKRLKAIFGSELEITKNVLNEAQAAARKKAEERKKEAAKTGTGSTEVSNASLNELLRNKPIVFNGQEYKNLSETPQEVQRVVGPLLDAPLSPTLSSKFSVSSLDAVLAMLGLEDQVTKMAAYHVANGAALEWWRIPSKTKNKKA